MTPIEKFAQGRKFIMRKQAFFSTIMHNLTVIEQDGTMATDGKSLFWSPVWVAIVSVFITTFVILHELLHVVLKHPYRRGDKDPEVWNIACDYVVNAYIVYMGGISYARRRSIRREILWYVGRRCLQNTHKRRR